MRYGMGDALHWERQRECKNWHDLQTKKAEKIFTEKEQRGDLEVEGKVNRNVLMCTYVKHEENQNTSLLDSQPALATANMASAHPTDKEANIFIFP